MKTFFSFNRSICGWHWWFNYLRQCLAIYIIQIALVYCLTVKQPPIKVSLLAITLLAEIIAKIQCILKIDSCIYFKLLGFVSQNQNVKLMCNARVLL